MLETGAFADAPGALWPLFALALGLLIGSFANVCIHRLPLGESVVSPRSRCPSCRAPIAAADNVPVFSYLFLKGRCRHCGARISPRYPAVELANGLLYLAVALRDGPTPRALVDMAFVTALLVLSLIDLDHQILPNVITIPGIAAGVAASLVFGGWPGALRSALAALGGYLAFWAVAAAYRRTRGVEGLGQGDWKLAAMLGAFLGWERMLLTVLLASLLGTIVGVALIVARGRSSQHPLPLGTFLGLAGVVVLFIGQPLVDWYGQLLRGMSVAFPTRRAGAVAALLVVGALDLHTTAVGLRAHARLRERSLSGLRQATVQARPRLSALAAPGGAAAAQQTAAAAVEAGLAATAEVFSLDGTRIAAAPAPAVAGSRHWPLDRDLPRLRAGEVLTTTQLAAVPPRIYAYALLSTASGPALLRVSADAADLVADLRDRQETFVTQALGLLLVLATMALLAPARGEPAAPSPPVGLVAYEEAMGRLRARDEEMARQHQLERRRMEGELRDNAPFVRAGELTVGVVHEIRNGLGTILGYARLVQSAGGPGAEHAGGIVEECETLETVVRRFMEFVKDDSLRPSTFDLGRMLTRVAARESKARVGPETHLPRGSVGVVEADEDLLERAFENLVRNALEAAGPSGQVWIEVERGRDSVLVTIADNGPGMPPDVRSSLRPFFTTKSGGLGLGLPLAYKIVRQHGGDLLLAERSPHGLAVRVRLPLARSIPDVSVTDGNPAAPGDGVRSGTPPSGS